MPLLIRTIEEARDHIRDWIQADRNVLVGLAAHGNLSQADVIRLKTAARSRISAYENAITVLNALEAQQDEVHHE